MKRRGLRMIALLLFVILGVAACSPTPAPTPDANVPLTMETACDYGGQVVELEGMLILPRSVSCSEAEPLTCRLTLYDPFRELAIDVDIPVHTFSRTEGQPINTMATLPESFTENDLYIRTANDRLVGD
ncbi:hypothetical protein FDZ74_13660, partial [bacterium]